MISGAVWGRLAAASLVAAVVAPATSAWAEIRSLEVVGVVPLDAKARRSGIPKDRAIDEALWEGVSRVAAELLVDSIVEVPEPDGGEAGDGGEPEDERTRLRKALGDDMLAYTESFRIVEDQGERPALFTDNPDAATEYVVVVAVQVDVARVRERLKAAGLLDTGGLAMLTGILLEVQGLTQYGGYDELVELLESESIGAVSVSPLEFSRDRILLHVEAEWGAGELLERLLGAASPQLRITLISVREADARLAEGADVRGEGGASLVLEIEWTPPPPDEEAPGAGADRLGVRPPPRPGYGSSRSTR